METRVNVKGERVELTQAEIDARQAELDAYVEPVPQMVTKAQGRLALYDTGKLAEVEAALNALEDPRILIEWETRETLSRDRDLVNIVLSGIGMIDSEIDDLFILAASL